MFLRNFIKFMDRDTDTTNRSLKSGHFIDVKYFEKRFLFTLKMAIELLKLYLELDRLSL